MVEYLYKCISAYSQLMNVVLFNGSPNESVSARAWRENRQTAIALINGLFFWQSNHCRGAFHKDKLWATQYLGL